MRKKEISEPERKILECAWRNFKELLTLEQKITKCQECYDKSNVTTEYCEHIVNYEIPYLIKNKEVEK